MSEYEIIELASEYLDRTWTVMQFWASVSFGLIAVAYFAARHLNLLFTSGLTLLYVAFTGFTMSILRIHNQVFDGFVDDLEALEKTGTALSHGAKQIVGTNTGIPESAAIVSVFFGTFLGVLFFLWYSYAKRRQ